LFYIIYKTTNITNGKHYIGKHQTKDLDDGYFGSGKLLKRAIKKYGKDNFYKEVLHICSTEKEMNLREKILVVPDPEISYNLCSGGQGGFGYINDNDLGGTFGYKHNQESLFKIKEKALSRIEHHSYLLECRNKKFPNGTNGFLGKKHTEETKIKIGLANKKFGENNSQYGTCWITNGQDNKKIKKNELDNWLERGYYKGRK
jgi:hypothetical protein